MTESISTTLLRAVVADVSYPTQQGQSLYKVRKLIIYSRKEDLCVVNVHSIGSGRYENSA